MNRNEYAAYLKTPQWRELRQKALIRAGCRCQVCNSREQLNVHHRTYANVGQERLMDLTVLCRACHQLYHFPPQRPSDLTHVSEILPDAIDHLFSTPDTVQKDEAWKP